MRKCAKTSLLGSVLLLLGCAVQSQAFGGGSAANYFSNDVVLQVAKAAADGDTAKVKSLHDKGVDIDASGKDGVTPLLWALSQGNKAGVEELLILGADPNHQSDDGDSMMSLSVQMTDFDFLRLALKYHGNPNLHISKGPWRTPLMQAMGPSRLPIIKQLVEAGADVNYQDPVTGDTPAMGAADLNQFDAVYYLLEHGADYAIKNKSGNTIVFQIDNNNIDPQSPLYAWRQKVIEFLRSKGIPINPRIP